MSMLTTPPAVADALRSACEPLFWMIETDPTLLEWGTHLIMALLREAQAKQICGVLIIRQLQARLLMVRRIAIGVAALPITRGPSLG